MRHTLRLSAAALPALQLCGAIPEKAGGPPVHTHQSQSPCQCNRCTTAFAHKGSRVAQPCIRMGTALATAARPLCTKGGLSPIFKSTQASAPYQCSHCGKAFIHRVHLIDHLHIHMVAPLLLQPVPRGLCQEEYLGQPRAHPHG